MPVNLRNIRLCMKYEPWQMNWQGEGVVVNGFVLAGIAGIAGSGLVVDLKRIFLRISHETPVINTALISRNEQGDGQGIRHSSVPGEEVFITPRLYPNQYANAEAAIEEALEKPEPGYIDTMLRHHPERTI